MKMWHTFHFLFFLLIGFVLKIKGFNVNTQKPIFLTKTPSDKPTYFGYSSLLQNGAAYLGAPAHEVSGGVYRCDFDGLYFGAPRAFPCAPITNNDESEKYNDWFGASLAQMENQVFTCAPRKIRTDFMNLIAKTGACYKYNPNTKGTNKMFDLNKVSTEPGDWSELTVMGMAMIPGKNRELIFGLPLARTKDFSWSDARMVGSIANFDISANKLRMTLKKDSPWATDTKASFNDPHVNDLSGTSIAKGKFFYDGTADDHLVVGAPTANKLLGRVYLCPNCFNPEYNSGSRRTSADSVVFKSASVEISGDQFGAKFGQTVCAVDINGDSFDDLLVGAPLHAPSKGFYDTGAVYVYRTSVTGSITRLELITKSLKRGPMVSGARFGSALTNLGRLDSDIYQDFAVGAPFDGPERSGIVYIYRGSSNLDFEEMPQMLTPRGLNRPAMRGFGFSISGMVDVDGNGRQDLLIGAILSEEAVVLRSLEVYPLKPRSFAVTPPKAVNPASGVFEVSIKVHNEMPIIENLAINIELKNLDDRIHFAQGSASLSTQIEKGNMMSTVKYSFSARQTNFGVDLQNLGNIPRPIRFFAQLHWSLQRTSCSNQIGCPLLDPRSGLIEILNFTVNLHSGCDDIDNCKCQLILEGEEVMTQTVVVRKHLEVFIPVAIANMGSEPAFNTKMVLEVPFSIESPRGFECENKSGSREDSRPPGSRFECRLNTMRSGQHYDFQVPIKFVDQMLDAAAIPITIEVESACSNLDSRTFKLENRVILSYISNIIATYEMQRYDKHQNPYNETPIPFKHIYQLRNEGPSTTNKEIIFEILLPQTELLQIQKSPASSDDSIVECSESSSLKDRFQANEGSPRAGYKAISCSKTTCISYTCKIKPGFEEGSSVTITLLMTFDSQAANDDKDYDNFVVYTHLSGIKSELVHGSTEFFSTKTGFAQMIIRRWPVLLGVILVLIIISVIFFALYKTNSLSKMRIYKGQLEEEEKLHRNSRVAQG